MTMEPGVNRVATIGIKTALRGWRRAKPAVPMTTVAALSRSSALGQADGEWLSLQVDYHPGPAGPPLLVPHESIPPAVVEAPARWRSHTGSPTMLSLTGPPGSGNCRAAISITRIQRVLQREFSTTTEGCLWRPGPVVSAGEPFVSAGAIRD